MTDPTGKITNLTRVIDGKTNRITVTDTDGDYGTPTVGRTSIMGFDNNDKVVVTGDVSVFNQDEIQNAFFKNYNTSDPRQESDLTDLTKVNFELKEGKISGDTSKPFALQDLANVVNADEPAGQSMTTNPQFPTYSNQMFQGGQNPSSDWMFNSSRSDSSGFAQPMVDPSFAMTSGNLMRSLAAFFNNTMNPSFGGGGDIGAMASYIWNSIPINSQSNPFNANQNPAAQAPAAQTPETQAPAAATQKPGEAVVTDGQINDDKAQPVVNQEENCETPAAVTEPAKPAATAKPAEAPKSEIEKTEYHKGEQVTQNEEGKLVKKYDGKDAKRIVEVYEDGQIVKKETVRVATFNLENGPVQIETVESTENFVNPEKLKYDFKKSMVAPSDGIKQVFPR